MKFVYLLLIPGLLSFLFCSPGNEIAANRSETTKSDNSEKLKVEENAIEPDSGITLTAENKFILIDSLIAKNNMTEFYERFIEISRKYSVIKDGKINQTTFDDSSGIYIYKITSSDKEILLLINASDLPRQVLIQTDHDEYFRDLLDETNIIQVHNKKIGLKVKPHWGNILLKDFFR